MAEYIEREAVCTLIKNFGKGAISDGRMELDAVDDIILLASAVERLPAADVVPVVHGRWIGRPLCGNANCRCSECGGVFQIHANLHGKVLQKYCPNCGAKIDVEEQDDE